MQPPITEPEELTLTHPTGSRDADQVQAARIVEGVIDSFAYQLADSDEIVVSLIAETNATSFSPDEIVVLRADYVSNSRDEIQFEALIQLQGDQIEERTYSGDRIELLIGGTARLSNEAWSIDEYSVHGANINDDDVPEADQDPFHFGQTVICIDPRSKWYTAYGTIVGKNSNNLGVRFQSDPNPPATGRWLAKSKFRLISEYDTARPWISEVVIHNDHVHQGLGVKLEDATTIPTHLILTGRNGSGKSTVLKSLYAEITTQLWAGRLRDHTKEGRIVPSNRVSQIVGDNSYVEPIFLDGPLAIASKRSRGTLLVVFLPPSRKLLPSPVHGPSTIDWEGLNAREDLSSVFMQYLVNRRTEQAFASEAEDDLQATSIRDWFRQLEATFQRLLDEDALRLVFKSEQFRFDLTLREGSTVRFEQLPDGYSSILRIWAELMLREEALRHAHPDVREWSGIAIIDELEAHLHLELQETILPTLLTIFPKYQFIISTHSPAVIASVPNATVLDMSSGQAIPSADMRGKSYGTLVTGHFGMDDDLDEDTSELRNRWRGLLQRTDRSEADEERRVQRPYKVTSIPSA